MKTMLYWVVGTLFLAAPALPEAILACGDGVLETRDAGEPLRCKAGQEPAHAWVWSDDSAPRRLAPDDLGKDLPADRERIAVRVAHPEERLPAGYRLLAAPVEMWTEVPEAMLPAWEVPPDARLNLPRDSARSWRLRLVGPGRGTWWTDVPAGRRTATLSPLTGETRSLRVLDAEGEPFPGAFCTVLAGDSETPAASRRGVLAQARSNDDGDVEIPSLPDAHAIQIIVSAEGHAPSGLTARPATLPHELRLRAGAALSGRFVDPQGKPLPGVDVRADAWVSPRVSATVARRGQSDEDGEWSLAGLPPGKVAVAAEAQGYAAFTTRLEVGAEGADLAGGCCARNVSRSLRARIRSTSTASCRRCGCRGRSPSAASPPDSGF